MEGNWRWEPPPQRERGHDEWASGNHEQLRAGQWDAEREEAERVQEEPLEEPPELQEDNDESEYEEGYFGTGVGQPGSESESEDDDETNSSDSSYQRRERNRGQHVCYMCNADLVRNPVTGIFCPNSMCYQSPNYIVPVLMPDEGWHKCAHCENEWYSMLPSMQPVDCEICKLKICPPGFDNTCLPCPHVPPAKLNVPTGTTFMLHGVETTKRLVQGTWGKLNKSWESVRDYFSCSPLGFWQRR